MPTNIIYTVSTVGANAPENKKNTPVKQLPNFAKEPRVVAALSQKEILKAVSPDGIDEKIESIRHILEESPAQRSDDLQKQCEGALDRATQLANALRKLDTLLEEAFREAAFNKLSSNANAEKPKAAAYSDEFSRFLESYRALSEELSNIQTLSNDKDAVEIKELQSIEQLICSQMHAKLLWQLELTQDIKIVEESLAAEQLDDFEVSVGIVAVLGDDNAKFKKITQEVTTQFDSRNSVEAGLAHQTKRSSWPSQQGAMADRAQQKAKKAQAAEKVRQKAQKAWQKAEKVGQETEKDVALLVESYQRMIQNFVEKIKSLQSDVEGMQQSSTNAQGVSYQQQIKQEEQTSALPFTPNRGKGKRSASADLSEVNRRPLTADEIMKNIISMEQSESSRDIEQDVKALEESHTDLSLYFAERTASLQKEITTLRRFLNGAQQEASDQSQTKQEKRSLASTFSRFTGEVSNFFAAGNPAPIQQVKSLSDGPSPAQQAQSLSKVDNLLKNYAGLSLSCAQALTSLQEEVVTLRRLWKETQGVSHQPPVKQQHVVSPQATDAQRIEKPALSQRTETAPLKAPGKKVEQQLPPPPQSEAKQPDQGVRSKDSEQPVVLTSDIDGQEDTADAAELASESAVLSAAQTEYPAKASDEQQEQDVISLQAENREAIEETTASQPVETGSSAESRDKENPEQQLLPQKAGEPSDQSVLSEDAHNVSQEATQPNSDVDDQPSIFVSGEAPAKTEDQAKAFDRQAHYRDSGAFDEFGESFAGELALDVSEKKRVLDGVEENKNLGAAAQPILNDQQGFVDEPDEFEVIIGKEAQQVDANIKQSQEELDAPIQSVEEALIETVVESLTIPEAAQDEAVEQRSPAQSAAIGDELESEFGELAAIEISSLDQNKDLDALENSDAQPVLSNPQVLVVRPLVKTNTSVKEVPHSEDRLEEKAQQIAVDIKRETEGAEASLKKVNKQPESISKLQPVLAQRKTGAIETAKQWPFVGTMADEEETGIESLFLEQSDAPQKIANGQPNLVIKHLPQEKKGAEELVQRADEVEEKAQQVAAANTKQVSEGFGGTLEKSEKQSEPLVWPSGASSKTAILNVAKGELKKRAMPIDKGVEKQKENLRHVQANFNHLVEPIRKEIKSQLPVLRAAEMLPRYLGVRAPESEQIKFLMGKIENHEKKPLGAIGQKIEELKSLLKVDELEADKRLKAIAELRLAELERSKAELVQNAASLDFRKIQFLLKRIKEQKENLSYQQKTNEPVKAKDQDSELGLTESSALGKGYSQNTPKHDQAKRESNIHINHLLQNLEATLASLEIGDKEWRLVKKNLTDMRNTANKKQGGVSALSSVDVA